MGITWWGGRGWLWSVGGALKGVTWNRPTLKSFCFPERRRREELCRHQMGALTPQELTPPPRGSLAQGHLPDVLPYPRAQGAAVGGWRRSPDQNNKQITDK